MGGASLVGLGWRRPENAKKIHLATQATKGETLALYTWPRNLKLRTALKRPKAMKHNHLAKLMLGMCGTP